MNLKGERGNQKRWPSIVRSLMKDGFIARKQKRNGVRGWVIRKVT